MIAASSLNGCNQPMKAAAAAHPGPAAPPAAGNLNGKARLDRFIAEAEKQYASIADISSLDDLPAHVSGWLRNQNLPQQCVIAPILEDLGWQETRWFC